MSRKSVLIIVPAFNEEASIVDVIKKAKKYLPVDVIVVDDGSTDNTKILAEKIGVKVIILPFNLGIGGAVQTGLIYAKQNGYKTAIQLDADGQHDPKYLPLLLENLNEKVDLVVGSRYLKKTNYKTPFIRLLGIKIFSQLIFISCRKRVNDSTSGYRVFGIKSINFFSSNYPQEFPEPRSIVYAFKHGLKIKEVAVEMRKRQGGVSSVANIYKAIYLMISISIAILVDILKSNNNYNE